MVKNQNGIVSGNLLILFFSIMILPFLILFFFNHPSADDWGLSQNTKTFGFMKAQENYYKNWTGKYFSNAVLSFNPLYFSSITWYKISGLLIMILFLLTLYLLISKAVKDKLNVSEKLLITLAIFFLYLYSMPSLPQSFYWLTAAVVYQTGVILLMIFLILYLKYIIVLFILFFVPAWSMGRSPVNRTVNIIYFVFLAGWFYNISVLIFYAVRKFNFTMKVIPNYIYALVFVIVALFLYKKNNVKLAYSDLLRGTAAGYNSELVQRYNYISQNPADSVVVPSLKNLPRSVYFVDIFEDPETDLNRQYALFFGKKSASVKSDSLNNQK